MNIIFKESVNYFYEGIYAIYKIVNKDTTIELKEDLKRKYVGQTFDKKINELFDDEIYLINLIKGNIAVDDEITKFLFTNIKGFSLPLASVFQSRFNETREEAILDYLYGNVYGKSHVDYINSLSIKNGDDLYKVVNSMNIDVEIKFSIMRLYYDYNILRSFVNEKINKISEIIKENIHTFNNRINKLMRYIKEEVDKNSLDFFENTTRLKLRDDSNYVFFPSILASNGITFYGNNKGTDTDIAIGIDVFEIINLKQNFKKNDEIVYDFFKIISDKTKFDIIKLLSKERLYNAQIAERLSLSTATISYHMNQLLSINIVYVEKENNKIFYILDKKNIKSILGQFVEFIES